MQQADSENAMGRTQLFDCFRRFKEGRTSVESDPHSGRLSTSRNEEMNAIVRTIVRNNRRLTVREIADDCGISVGSRDAVLTDDLHMTRVCVKFVPFLLTDDQHEQHQTIARDLFELSCEDLQFLKYIVTGRVLGLRVRSRDKRVIVTVEGSHVSATKEGAPGAKQNKGHVTGVF